MQERDFIQALRAKAPSLLFATEGIGDDCAVLPKSSSELLVTTDMLLSGVHFDLASASPYLVGRKSLAVNLSDIAAMAGTPLAAVVALALPQGSNRAFAAELMQGIFDLAKEFNVDIVGGDTNSWSKSSLVVAITLIGKAHNKGSVLRKGAMPGDAIVVSGKLGGSLQARHLDFKPRVQLGKKLRDYYDIHAMIDLSDGLSTDLNHIAQASNVGACLEEESLQSVATKDVQSALNDGEDFELCFCLAEEEAEKLLNDKRFDQTEEKLTCIGFINSGQTVVIKSKDSTERLLLPQGYQHRW